MSGRITCTRKFHFSAGHRILGHENVCGGLHGHNYRVFVTCSVPGDGLDQLGRVIDFGVIKEIVGEWIDKTFDHKMILQKDDPAIAVCTDHALVRVVKDPPTAENLARLILKTCTMMLSVDVDTVRVWETENCYAEVSNDVQD